MLIEHRIREARNKRYKKPICKNINMDEINRFCWEAMEASSDVAYAAENKDVFVDAMGGDEEEAFEFRMAFTDLEVDVERFQNDLQETWIPECFDLFFAGVGGDGGGWLGYDAYEEDYMSLDGFEVEAAQREAIKQLARLTKAELLEAAGKCLRIVTAYIALKSRYEDLQAGLNIIRGVNSGLLAVIKQINALYDADMADGLKWGKHQQEFNRLVGQLPDECWVR